MVLDIRYLRKSSKPEESPNDQGHDSQVDADLMHSSEDVVVALESPPCSDFEELLDAASVGEVADRAVAIAQLRVLVPSRVGIARLCDIVEDTGDPRRLLAVQMLGYHRSWMVSKSVMERVLRWMRDEKDPEVSRALVWALRGKQAVAEFLSHEMLGVAREAALGLPINEATAPILVSTLMTQRATEVRTILLQRLKTSHKSLASTISALVVDSVGSVDDEEICALVACLSQVQIFEVFLEKKGLPNWDPQADEKEIGRLRQWHQLARLVEIVLLKTPTSELVRHLINGCARDEAFARRHASFLSKAMNNTDAVFGNELLRDLERLTIEATEDRLLKMAGMLLDLRGKFDNRLEPAAEALLEEWKAKSPALKLKIYHLQQGLQ